MISNLIIYLQKQDIQVQLHHKCGKFAHCSSCMDGGEKQISEDHGSPHITYNQNPAKKGYFDMAFHPATWLPKRTDFTMVFQPFQPKRKFFPLKQI